MFTSSQLSSGLMTSELMTSSNRNTWVTLWALLESRLFAFFYHSPAVFNPKHLTFCSSNFTNHKCRGNWSIQGLRNCLKSKALVVNSPWSTCGVCCAGRCNNFLYKRVPFELKQAHAFDWEFHHFAVSEEESVS